MGGLLEPSRTALVIIDMQNGFCHPEGSLAAVMSVAETSSVVSPVRELVEAAHSAEIPVIWSHQEHVRGDRSIDRSRLDNPQAALREPPCLQGTWDAELVEELGALAADDIHVIKRRASAFYGTGLELELRLRGLDTVVIAGVTTSYCVDGTARDAYSRDLGVIVVGDACASPWPDLHAATLKNVATFLGTVATVAEVTAAFATPTPEESNITVKGAQS